MKVILLNQTFHPDRVATAQQVLDIALFLKKKDCEVSVVTDSRGYESREIRFPRQESFNGIEIHRVRSTGLGKKNVWRRLCDSLTFDAAAMLKLFTLPRHDVVISFTSPPLIGFLGALYCRMRGARSVQWLMDVNPDAAMEVGYLRRGSVTAGILTKIFHFTLKSSHSIVVLDRWMKKRIASHGAEESRIIVIPPWSVQDPKSDGSEIAKGENPFAREHELVDKFVVLYSGNFSIAHPLHTMLEAAERLKHDPAVKFLFIGDGIRSADIDSARESRRLSNVEKLPWQSRELLRYTLSSADLHVVVMGNAMSGLAHTSKIYGILSVGKPYIFVGPRDSHVGDLLAECPHGYQVEHGDVEGFVRVVERVRGLSKQDLKTISAANREYVRSHYSPERCLEPLPGVIFC